jgi:hypothetical protein
MKNKFVFIPYFIILLLILFACRNTALNESPIVAHRDVNGIVVCDISAIKDTIDFPLSRLFSDFEIIRLENSDDALVGDGKIWVSENYLGIYSLSRKFLPENL